MYVRCAALHGFKRIMSKFQAECAGTQKQWANGTAYLHELDPQSWIPRTIASVRLMAAAAIELQTHKLKTATAKGLESFMLTKNTTVTSASPLQQPRETGIKLALAELREQRHCGQRIQDLPKEETAQTSTESYQIAFDLLPILALQGNGNFASFQLRAVSNLQHHTDALTSSATHPESRNPRPCRYSGRLAVDSVPVPVLGLGHPLLLVLPNVLFRAAVKQSVAALAAKRTFQ